MNPLSNGSSSFGEVTEVVLPNALLLSVRKEARRFRFAWGVGDDEFLTLVVAEGREKMGKLWKIKLRR
jgi:hypothetical protein